MSNQAWLEQFARELRRRGLPAAYTARLTDELSDHLADFMEEAMSTDATDVKTVSRRMGAPLAIATQAAQQFHRRTFSGRHPILMFVFLPVVLLWAGWVIDTFGVLGLSALIKSRVPGISSDEFSPAGVAALKLVCSAVVLLPAALGAVLFSWLAARGGLRRRWPITAFLIMGVIVGLVFMDVRISPIEGKSMLNFGAGVSTGLKQCSLQLARLGVPVIIGTLFLAHFTRRQASVASTS